MRQGLTSEAASYEDNGISSSILLVILWFCLYSLKGLYKNENRMWIHVSVL